MQKLAQEISSFTHEDGYTDFRDAAKNWAASCLGQYDGLQLQKGLAISAAMAEFLNELERDL